MWKTKKLSLNECEEIWVIESDETNGKEKLTQFSLTHTKASCQTYLKYHVFILCILFTNHIIVCAKQKEILLANYKHYANLHSSTQCNMNDDGYIGICV